jgi:tetratricopeptide (TPR) repeat protein
MNFLWKWLLSLVISSLSGVVYAQYQSDHFLLAVVAGQNGDHQKALELYETASGDGIPTEILSLAKGKTLLELKRTSEARELFQMIEQKKPGQASLLMSISYALDGNTAETLIWMKQHLNSKYKQPKSEIRLHPAFVQIEKTKEWIDLWNQEWYTRQEQQIAEIRFLIKNKQFEEALNHADLFLETFKKNHEVYYLRGVIYENLGEWKYARSDFEKAISIKSGQDNYHFALSRSFRKLEKQKETIREMRKAIQINPYLPDYILEMGIALYEGYENEESISWLSKYLKLRPGDPETRLFLARNLFETERYEESLAHLNQLLADEKLLGEVYQTRGNVYFRKSELKKAYDDYSMSLDLNPSDYRTYVNRGVVRLEMQDNNGACRDFEKAFRLGYREAYQLMKIHCK